MNYWLVKTEPGTYSWDDLCNEKKTPWDGVRNYQARNFLKDMKQGDRVLVYHSGSERAVMGQATVSKEAFPDPTDENWIAVEIKVGKKLTHPVTLARVKSTKALADMKLIKNSRLSVQPVRAAEYNLVLKLSETAA